MPGEESAERVGVAGDVGGQQVGVGAVVVGPSVTLDHDLGDLAAEPAPAAGQRGQPDHDEAAGDGGVELTRRGSR